MRSSPGDRQALTALAQFLFEFADPRQAEQALVQLLRCAPDDPATHHNLGTVYLRLELYDQAIAAYKESLRWRSDSATTYVHLGMAYKGKGDVATAIECWHTAQRLDPAELVADRELRNVGAHELTLVGSGMN